VKPDVSILIVAYECRDELRECLRSIERARGGVDVEVVVTDNASTDGTVELLRTEFPDVRLVALPVNVGFARGVNRAAEIATGDYLLLLNPDTVVHDDGGLGRLLEFARSHPEHGLYGGRTLWPDGTLCPGSVWGAPSLWSHACFAFLLSSAFKGSGVFDPDSLGSWQRDSVRRVGVVTGCLLLVSRDDWDALGGFDERFFMYGEDVDLSLRAARAGRPPVLVPSIEITHVVGVSSESRPGRKTLVMKGKATVARKHSGPLGRALALGLLQLGVGIRALLRIDPWPEVWRERSEWIAGYPPAAETRAQLARSNARGVLGDAS
jgi:N-acetylglucosaminyl-diphospho-decaprenol L-rhamnosyltransferase